MHQKSRKLTRSGFTLIELMIAIAFVGGLLVTITLVILQIMSLYNKGLTLKEVDSVSRVVIRDMQQSIASSSQFQLTYMQNDAHGNPTTPTVATTLAEAAEHGTDYYNNDAGGRLCTGTYSYIWNTGQAIKGLDAHIDPTTGKLTTNSADATYKAPDNSGSVSYPLQIVQTHRSDGSIVDTIVRFMKKRDTAKAMCHLPAGETAATTTFDSVAGNAKDFLPVLGSGDNNLMLYKFTITTPDYSQYGRFEGSQITALATFYSISLSIGTQMGDENRAGLVSTQDASCKAPKDAHVNDAEYCAVNIVNFVARTGSISR